MFGEGMEIAGSIGAGVIEYAGELLKARHQTVWLLELGSSQSELVTRSGTAPVPAQTNDGLVTSSISPAPGPEMPT